MNLIRCGKAVDSKNILLTGVPRSGTTLCCTLLNRCDGVLALVEPIPGDQWSAGLSASAAVARICECVDQTRTAAQSGAVPSLRVGDGFADNVVAGDGQSPGVRPVQSARGQVRLDSPMPADDTLVVKHNALFAALLPRLLERFPVVAVIRNPVAVLASWQTVDLPVHRGRIPVGELFAPTLATSLEREPDVLTRQLMILDWFFDAYRRVPPSRLVRYEDLVAGRATALGTIGDQQAIGAGLVGVTSRNTAYDPAVLRALASRLIEYGGTYLEQYTEEDLEAVAS